MLLRKLETLYLIEVENRFDAAQNYYLEVREIFD